MRWTEAVKPVEGGGDTDRSPGIAAERKIARIDAASSGRPARRSAWYSVWCAQICRRTVMYVDARETIEEFIADGLTDNSCASIENAFDRRGMSNRRLLICEPIWTARARACPGDVVHLLDDRRQARE